VDTPRPSAPTFGETLTNRLGPDPLQTITTDWVQQILARPCRCRSCGRELHALASVLAGEGPLCRARRAGRS
jgi:hypothetical protein